MFRQFIPTEDKLPTEAKQYRFFTVNGVNVMGDIISIHNEWFPDIFSAYVTNPSAIYKAIVSTDDPAIFFGNEKDWCVYVSGRYVTSEQINDVQLLPDLSNTGDTPSIRARIEFWGNFPTYGDKIILQFNKIKQDEIEKKKEKVKNDEIQSAKMRADHKNLEKLPPHILAQLENILEGVDTKGDQPFKIFVDNYLANPKILNTFNIQDLIENPDWWLKFPFEPLIQSDTSDLSELEKKDMTILSNMSREEIMKHGNVSGKEGKDGKTFIVKGVGEKGKHKQYAVKMYHTYKYIPGSDHFTQKSIRMIQKEVYLQERAAKVGICPRILALNEDNRYVIMEKMEETIVAYAKRNRGEKSEYVLPEVHQDRIIEMMYKLDEVGVLHNDGNPLNLMFNEYNELMLIDFGLSELIDDAMLEKRGIHPNVSLTMWDFNRKLGYYRITTSKLKKLCDKYTKDFKLGLNRARLKKARTSSSSEGV